MHPLSKILTLTLSSIILTACSKSFQKNDTDALSPEFSEVLVDIKSGLIKPSTYDFGTLYGANKEITELDEWLDKKHKNSYVSRNRVQGDRLKWCYLSQSDIDLEIGLAILATISSKNEYTFKKAEFDSFFNDLNEKVLSLSLIHI